MPLVTVILIVGLLAWAIHLWQRDEATVGDVVLVCTLGISVLSATRDFAVALVDVTQHFARLSEALVTLLSPHELTDHPQAAALAPKAARGSSSSGSASPIAKDRKSSTSSLWPSNPVRRSAWSGRQEAASPPSLRSCRDFTICRAVAY